MGELYQGDEAPKVYRQVIDPGDSGLDLTTVTGAVFQVLKPDGVEVTWTCSLSAASINSLTLSYPLVPINLPGTPSDLDASGDYVIYARLTIPAGIMDCTRVRKYVRGKYEAP